MTSVFLMGKPRLSKAKEEPQRAPGRRQADSSVPTASSLHKEAQLCAWCSVLAARVALWLLPSTVPGASWIRSFSLHHDQFSCAGGNGQRSIDEFSGTAAVCLNKALFSIPRVLARRPSSPPAPPGARSPAVPACLHTGSWRAWQQPHPGVFLSGMNLSPSELGRKITRESLVL